MLDPIRAVSPIDGRYQGATNDLADSMSEYGLIAFRLRVMTRWVSALASSLYLPMRRLTVAEEEELEQMAQPTVSDALVVKAIETTGYGRHARTNHDVKACELWLRDKFEATTLGDLVEWIHFGLTSEDVNNMAYALMLQTALSDAVRPALQKVELAFNGFAQLYADVSMLARTHGQPASPTTLGKEFKVFAARLRRQHQALEDYAVLVKVNGASGNYNALVAAFSHVDWRKVTKDFIASFGIGKPWITLVQNETTTQIEPHDTYAELFDILRRTNVILIDACQDVWRYVSDDWLVQKPAAGETGSSTMPHKVNPIDWENAEGNLGIANALLNFFSHKLPISRLQRDLSDSTVERNFGSAFAYSLVAYKAILRGFGKISANEAKIAAVLSEHPEVITEAYQTVLRAEGFPNAYMALKDISRGKKLTMGDLWNFVADLDVPEAVKDRLLAITPANYVGLAGKLAKQ